MALETRDSAAVGPGTGVSPWVLALSGADRRGRGPACVGAWWAAEQLRAELALRPPVVLFDMAGAVRDVAPDRLAAVVAREKARARRLAEGGVLVLDAQAVIAAPPDLYLDPSGPPTTREARPDERGPASASSRRPVFGRWRRCSPSGSSWSPRWPRRPPRP